jgi:diguanylate cyclase (GGDEF)-like protein
LLFIDLDGFKRVNDTHGHTVGDQLLQGVAGRLLQSMRQSDLIGHLGGDEFVVLSTDCPDRESAALIATKLIAALREPFVIDGLVVNIGASIGIAICPDQAHEVEPLIALADAAMYLAKSDGRNGASTTPGGLAPTGYRFSD